MPGQARHDMTGFNDFWRQDMSYKAPLKDMLFDIKHIANIDAVAQMPGFEEAGFETAQAVLEECPDDMKFFEQRILPEAISRLEGLIEAPFVRLDYKDAIEILINADKKFEFKPEWGLDLQTEHERFLTEKHFKAPVIVMNYPTEIKAFYMRLSSDEKTVAALDVLAPGIGEIIGGSQREERLDVLERRMDELGLDKNGYDWYLDLRKYGTVPLAGFGLGFERLVMYVTGMTNIRDVIPFPRTPQNAEF